MSTRRPKILSIVGARPQFVKLAPLSRELRKHFHEVIVHTGQHYDPALSDQFFKDLDIPQPDHHLGVGSASHAVQTAGMLEGIEKRLLAEKPDLVIVFGDTNSTLAGALAAARGPCPAVHIEAGLRSFNRRMPEEINRIVADHICDHLFAPTANALRQLQREGLGERSILTGDIMADALLDNLGKARRQSGILEKLELKEDSFYLLTLHRPANVDHRERLESVLGALETLDRPVIWPIHPRANKMVNRFGLQLPAGLQIIPPCGYLDFLRLECAADKILTDSGGIQKEAYILQKPCLTLRRETEWTETVRAGWNRLLEPGDPDFGRIVGESAPPDSHPDLFGKDVARQMTAAIQKILHSPGVGR